MTKSRKAKTKKKKDLRSPPSSRTDKKAPAVSIPPAPEAVQAEPPKITPYPKAGKKVADFEENLKKQIEDHEQAGEPKRGPGRPRKPRADEPPPQLSEDVIRNAVCAPFDVWSTSQKVPALELTNAEARSISAPVKQLLDYYLPEMPAITIAWVSLAISSYAIMTTRLSMLAQIRAQKKAEREPIQPTAPPGQTPTATPSKRPQTAPAFPTTNEIQVQHE